SHPCRSDYADRSYACIVLVSRRNKTEKFQTWIRMLGPDHDREPRPVDVFVQQLDEPLFFFDHLEQRLQGAESETVIFAEQRRSPVHIKLAIVGQVGEGR